MNISLLSRPIERNFKMSFARKNNAHTDDEDIWASMSTGLPEENYGNSSELPISLNLPSLSKPSCSQNSVSSSSSSSACPENYGPYTSKSQFIVDPNHDDDKVKQNSKKFTYFHCGDGMKSVIAGVVRPEEVATSNFPGIVEYTNVFRQLSFKASFTLEEWFEVAGSMPCFATWKSWKNSMYNEIASSKMPMMEIIETYGPLSLKYARARQKEHFLTWYKSLS